MTIFYTLVSVTIISAISLIGITTISINKDHMKNILRFLVSFAVGALMGDVFIHLLPEAIEKLGFGLKTSLLVILGFMIFFLVEKIVRWRHFNLHFESEHEKPVVMVNFVGDTLHNFLDGVLIAATYMVSIPLGLSTTISIALHELPQELGDFGIYVKGGLSVKKAVGLNLLSSLSAIAGSIIVLIAGTTYDSIVDLMIPVTAGGFIYIAGPDLIPELHEENQIKCSITQFIGIGFGVIIMVALTLLEVH